MPLRHRNIGRGSAEAVPNVLDQAKPLGRWQMEDFIEECWTRHSVKFTLKSKIHKSLGAAQRLAFSCERMN